LGNAGRDPSFREENEELGQIIEESLRTFPILHRDSIRGSTSALHPGAQEQRHCGVSQSSKFLGSGEAVPRSDAATLCRGPALSSLISTHAIESRVNAFRSDCSHAKIERCHAAFYGDRPIRADDVVPRFGRCAYGRDFMHSQQIQQCLAHSAVATSILLVVSPALESTGLRALSRTSGGMMG
jgi:hypothetical protein